MKYKKGIYIVLLIILVVFLVVMFLVFGIDNIKEEGYTSTIILGDNNTVWKYQNKSWINIKDVSTLENMSWKKYNVFDNNQYIGEHLLWYDDKKWYAFDDDKNAIKIDGSLIGISSNFDLKVGNFKESKVDDMTYVYQALKDNGLSTSSKFSSIYKVDYDFDSDSTDEEFYIITNVFPFDFEPSHLFSIAFMVKNNTIHYLYNEIVQNKSFNGCKPFYNTFLDTDNDDLFEVVLSCGKYSDLGQNDMLYGFVDGEFKLLISNM